VVDWWANDPTERYWCEITDRVDLGNDLRCPQGYEDGREYLSYSFIKEIWPGDLIFHYSTTHHASVGVSVAGCPLEERDIERVAHGTVGRSQHHTPGPRPGWWLPLYGYRELRPSLRLAALHNPDNETWTRNWIDTKAATWGRVAAPFQRYRGQLRASQGYLTKMPREFVQRWPELSTGADALTGLEDRLARAAEVLPPPSVQPNDTDGAPGFKPKSDAEYVALIQATVQRRSRKHERLVREVGEWLQAHGHRVSAPHPKDLQIAGTPPTIVEAKIVGERPSMFAVREATAQLLMYRYLAPGLRSCPKPQTTPS
jgi:hypothetical protein